MAAGREQMIITIKAISRLFWPTREATKEENNFSFSKRHCFVTKSENRLKCSPRGYLDVKNTFFSTHVLGKMVLLGAKRGREYFQKKYIATF